MACVRQRESATNWCYRFVPTKHKGVGANPDVCHCQRFYSKASHRSHLETGFASRILLYKAQGPPRRLSPQASSIKSGAVAFTWPHSLDFTPKSNPSCSHTVPNVAAQARGVLAKMAKQLLVNTMEALKGLSPPGSPITSRKSPSSNQRLKTLRKSLQKRGSKLAIWKSGRELESAPQPITDEMIRLETVILSQKGRQLLVQYLLSLPGNYSVKVRFINAVDTYDAADTKEERQRLGQKLIDTFISKDSMFFLALPEDRAEDILNGDLDRLLGARRDILGELASSPEVMAIVGEVETMDGV
jgi:hypothetical protein